MTSRKMTKEEGRAFKERWRRINEFEIEELRRMSPEEKVRQFFALRRWAIAFGWTKALEEGVGEVRERWVRIRKAYGAESKKTEPAA